MTLMTNSASFCQSVLYLLNGHASRFTAVLVVRGSMLLRITHNIHYLFQEIHWVCETAIMCELFACPDACCSTAGAAPSASIIKLKVHIVHPPLSLFITIPHCWVSRDLAISEDQNIVCFSFDVKGYLLATGFSSGTRGNEQCYCLALILFSCGLLGSVE